ncbi:hypothetical protein ACROYT_G003358 [Oculina patagonica]
MGREIKLTTHGLAFFVMIFMANLTCVEDLFNQGTCDWICTSDTDIDKESWDMIAQGRLVKLKTLYEERVDRECANQTDVTNSSTFATLWLKMATKKTKNVSPKEFEGRLQFLTHTILGELFSGQFSFGGYKEMNVSCIFKSTSIKRSATNYSSRRLTLRNPQSTLYYVEQMANYTKGNATFLTLLRTESSTRLSLGVTGANGSLDSGSYASDNELTVSNWWLLVAVIIWIVFLLYSSAILILFRPSEVNLLLARRIQDQEASGNMRTTLRTPVQVTEDDGGFIDQEIREGHVPPTEFPYEDNEPGHSQSDNVNSGTEDTHVRSEITGKSQEYVDSETTHPVVSSEETNKPSEEDSEMVVSLRRTYKSKEHKNLKNRKMLGCTGDHDDLLQDLEDTNDSPAPDSAINFRRLIGITPIASACDGSLGNETMPNRSDKIRNDKELDAQSNRSDVELSSPVTNDAVLSGSVRNDEELVAHSYNNVEELVAKSNRNDEELSVSGRNGEKLDAQYNRSDVELTASVRNDNELGGSCGTDSAEIESTGHVIDITDDSLQTNEDAHQESNVQSFHEERKTEYIRLIIVGETYPVGIGSCIGNNLFSTVNRNNVRNMVNLTLTLPSCKSQSQAKRQQGIDFVRVGNESRCEWQCVVVDSDFGEDMKKLITEYELITLDLKFEQRVDDKCLNQTHLYNATKPASIWTWLTNNNPSRGKNTSRQIIEDSGSVTWVRKAFEGQTEVQVLCDLRLTNDSTPNNAWAASLNDLIALAIMEEVANSTGGLSYSETILCYKESAKDVISVEVIRGILMRLPYYLPFATLLVVVAFYCWRCYNSFARKYNDLALKLYKHYTAHAQGGEEKQINPMEEKVPVIPKDLFKKACKDLMPLRKSIGLLVVRFFALLTFFFVVFAVIMETRDASDQAKATATFFTALVPKIIEMVLSKDPGMEKLDDELLDKKAKYIVDNYLTSTENSSYGVETGVENGNDTSTELLINEPMQHLGTHNGNTTPDASDQVKATATFFSASVPKIIEMVFSKDSGLEKLEDELLDKKVKSIVDEYSSSTENSSSGGDTNVENSGNSDETTIPNERTELLIKDQIDLRDYGMIGRSRNTAEVS